MSPHQLLPLALVFLAIVPSCWTFVDLSTIREQARNGSAHKMSPSDNFVKHIAQRAANKANVTVHVIEEAYFKVRHHH